ncbi:carbamoyltransferase [Rhodobacterales bacterium LSUCC0387]|nr:carbamoyltransferase [Rhodobacterales bacterium LSUCC0387]
MSIILGLNCYHPDSSACLVVDGKLVGAVAEERLGQRQKHSAAFPINAIKWLMAENGISLNDIHSIAVSRNPAVNFYQKAKFACKYPVGSIDNIRNRFFRVSSPNNPFKAVQEHLGGTYSPDRQKLVPVEHHVAHAASAYLASPFEEKTLSFSYDGSGDFVSSMIALCDNGNISSFEKDFVPNSLGHFYTALSQFVGFDQFGEEYKVMGLAPYGEPRFVDELSKIISVTSGHRVKIDDSYFRFEDLLRTNLRDADGVWSVPTLYSGKLNSLLGKSRARGSEILQAYMDIARSAQVVFQNAALKIVEHHLEKTSVKHLVLSGGCALNGVVNGLISKSFPEVQFYVPPAAGDDGTAVGAALYADRMQNPQRDRFVMDSAFWGPKYPSSRVLAAITERNLNFIEAKDNFHAAELTANYLAEGLVCGWYQGRSEWGARALGNRSILADPSIKNMKDIINKKIKKRESFRPFAPSILEEDVAEYFEYSVSSPFMTHVVPFKEKWRGVFPAVVHVDGTGRVQTVNKNFNGLYYHLISCLKKKTGHGVVLNTSFNENEPIVDTPEQAIACFLRTDMDVLVMDKFIVRKSERP